MICRTLVQINVKIELLSIVYTCVSGDLRIHFFENTKCSFESQFSDRNSRLSRPVNYTGPYLIPDNGRVFRAYSVWMCDTHTAFNSACRHVTRRQGTKPVAAPYGFSLWQLNDVNIFSRWMRRGSDGFLKKIVFSPFTKRPAYEGVSP